MLDRTKPGQPRWRPHGRPKRIRPNFREGLWGPRQQSELGQARKAGERRLLSGWPPIAGAVVNNTPGAFYDDFLSDSRVRIFPELARPGEPLPLLFQGGRSGRSRMTKRSFPDLNVW